MQFPYDVITWWLFMLIHCNYKIHQLKGFLGSQKTFSGITQKPFGTFTFDSVGKKLNCFIEDVDVLQIILGAFGQSLSSWPVLNTVSLISNNNFILLNELKCVLSYDFPTGFNCSCLQRSMQCIQFSRKQQFFMYFLKWSCLLKQWCRKHF